MSKSQRKKKLVLRSPEQIALIRSPTVINIIQFLQNAGPANVNQIGLAIGRKPNSLHYHLRKLVSNGLVRKVATERSGARTIAVIDLVADTFEGSNIHKDPDMRAATCEAADSLLRLAGRDYRAASEYIEQLVDRGVRRNITTTRRLARLGTKDLEKLNRLLDEMDSLFEKSVGNSKGQMIALTFTMTPIEEEDEP